MIKHILVLVILVFCASASVLAQNNILNEKKPRLVIGITIDNVESDFINKYWNTFQSGGFKRLVGHGAVCYNARLDIHNIKAACGAATISTGTYPAEHGIVGNEWYKQLTSQQQFAVKDDYYLTLGSDSDEGNVSCKQLKVMALADALKKSTNFKSKVYAVSLNSETAVLAAGHAADGAFWIDNTNGNLISSSYYIDKFPSWIQDFNDKKLADVYLNKEWDLLLPEESYKVGFEDDYVLEQGFWKRYNTFPYNLSKLAGMSEQRYELLKATPYGNRLVKDFALQLIDNEKLGDDEVTDLLMINFSTLDFANKWFEPGSVEIHDLYLRMDQDIAAILNYLDKILGKDNYLLYLSGTSTFDYSVNVLKDELNFPAGNFSPQSAMALLRSYLNALYGIGEWIESYTEEQVYFNHNLIEKKSMPLHEMQTKAALFLNQFEGIKSTVPAHLVETSNLKNERFKRIENSYCIQRSGDVILQLEEGWRPKYKYHEFYYSSVNRVPLLFYGSFVKPSVIHQKVSVIDILPTICNVMQVLPPDDASGQILDQIFW